MSNLLEPLPSCQEVTGRAGPIIRPTGPQKMAEAAGLGQPNSTPRRAEHGEVGRRADAGQSFGHVHRISEHTVL